MLKHYRSQTRPSYYYNTQTSHLIQLHKWCLQTHSIMTIHRHHTSSGTVLVATDIHSTMTAHRFYNSPGYSTGSNRHTVFRQYTHYTIIPQLVTLLVATDSHSTTTTHRNYISPGYSTGGIRHTQYCRNTHDTIPHLVTELAATQNTITIHI